MLEPGQVCNLLVSLLLLDFLLTAITPTLYIDGLVQERCGNALELRLSCTNLPICTFLENGKQWLYFPHHLGMTYQWHHIDGLVQERRNSNGVTFFLH